MVAVHFIDAKGVKRSAEAKPKQTVMEVAVKNNIPGIEAECGGACACATCHVYLDPDWTAKVPAASNMEADMLDFASDVKPTSRLSCQIVVEDALNGLVVHTPERQG